MSTIPDPVDRYVRDVLSRVVATAQEKERLAADLRDHLEELAAEEKPSWSELIDRMGPPEEVALAFQAENPFRYSSFLRRLVAFAGDFGVLVLLSLPGIAAIAFLVHLAESSGGAERMLAFGLTGAVCFAVFVAWILYFPLFEAHSGRTPGKHCMKIRVLRETGEPVGTGQAFLRRLSFFFELLVLDALFVLFTEKRQRALDVLVHTIVVDEPDGEVSPAAWVACLLLPAVAVCCLCTAALLFAGH